MMKIGIIVYSQTGNTFEFAEKLRAKLEKEGHDAQIERVTNVGKVRPGAKEIQLDNIPAVENYEGLVFASPVHAFSLAPAMAAYLNRLSMLGNRKIACCVTKMLPFQWTGGSQAIKQMKKICETKGGSVCGSAVVICAKGKREQNLNEAADKISKFFLAEYWEQVLHPQRDYHQYLKCSKKCIKAL